MSQIDANQIIPRLWLGNYYSSQNVDFIQSNRITVVINCTKDLPFLKLNGVYKYRIPIDDNLHKDEIENMSVWIGHILPIMVEHYNKGRSMLVHCMAGMQRSAIVVLSYLYAHHVDDPKMALYLMRQKRPIVFVPMMNFGLSFRSFFGDKPYKLLTSNC
jgi:hypothetical protein